MNSRNLNITLVEYCKDKSLDDISVEGEFHPQNDLELIENNGSICDYKIRGHSAWGVTFPSTKTLQEAKEKKEKIVYGFYHQHGEERVYLTPPLNIGAIGDTYDGLIPCLECKVGIRSKLK